VNRDTARRVVPLFRPYRAQVGAVVGLIVVTSTIGIINPLLIQVVFNKALFVPGGPNLHLLVILVAIGIVQTYETTRVGQLVMRDLRDRLYSHLQTLPLAFFTGTKTGEIQSRLANDVGGVQSVVTTTASTILANVVIFVSTIAAMIILSWQLTIVAVITVPVFFWLTKMVGERRRQVARSTQESLAAVSALSEEPCRCPGCCWPRCSATRRATPPATTRRTSAWPAWKSASRYRGKAFLPQKCGAQITQLCAPR
jgi:ATP-binding cassette subfamily B protein